MDYSLQGVFEWLQTQAQYALFIVLLVLILIFAARRAWVGMIGAIIGLAAVGIFILNPDIISDMAEWLGDKLNMGVIVSIVKETPEMLSSVEYLSN